MIFSVTSSALTDKETEGLIQTLKDCKTRITQLKKEVAGYQSDVKKLVDQHNKDTKLIEELIKSKKELITQLKKVIDEKEKLLNRERDCLNDKEKWINEYQKLKKMKKAPKKPVEVYIQGGIENRFDSKVRPLGMVGIQFNLLPINDDLSINLESGYEYNEVKVKAYVRYTLFD